MSKPYILIPAAGESRRFRESGYDTPKPFLMIKRDNGLTARMVDHVIAEAPDGEIIVGVKLGYDRSMGPHLGSVALVMSSKGQADTVYQMASGLVRQDAPVMVLDCDMIVPHLDLTKMMELLSVWNAVVAVTKTFDPNASRVNVVPYPTYFAEKEPISAWGIVGARAFKSVRLLRMSLKITLEHCRREDKEPYLSMTLNDLQPGTVFAHQIDNFVDWGTPERVKASGAEIVVS